MKITLCAEDNKRGLWDSYTYYEWDPIKKQKNIKNARNL
jgi:hypothetical protein